MDIKWFNAIDYGRKKNITIRPLLTYAVTAIEKTLIVHKFKTEDQAINTMPYIRSWERNDKVWKNEVRYFSPAANKYYKSRGFNDKIYNTIIVHQPDGTKTYSYNQ